MNKQERFSYHFKRLMNERNLKPRDLAERGHVSESYISQIINGLCGFGKKAAQKWADVFSCDVGEFYKPMEIKEGIAVIAYISAGEGIEAVDQFPLGEGLERVPLPPGYSQMQATEENIYALKVNGDSMVPRLYDGEIIYIKPSPVKELHKQNLVIFRDEAGLGWVKEIDLVNEDMIIFRSVGAGTTIVKKRVEITVLEKVFLTLHI